MPNRILKESINESNSLSQCSIFAQDLYKRLITYADDYGRFNADTQIMLARLYPRELDTVSHNDIIEALIELRGNNKINFYTPKWVKGEVYGAFPNWSEHQRVRDSKRKCPDPDDLIVNEWYLKRFVPMAMKEKILIRDKFKCQICGKNLSCGITDAKKLLKMSTGIFHFDHIVPHNQGGRATMENLRLTCERCNKTRKKFYTFEEIVEFTLNCGESEKVAASCGEIPPNPIQSNPNPNPESNPKEDTSDKPPQISFGEFQHVKMTQAQYDTLCKKYGQKLVDDKIASLDAHRQNKERKYLKYTDHYATIGNWCRSDIGKQQARAAPVKNNAESLKYPQRKYTPEEEASVFVNLAEDPD
jgi:hypothetical protein